MNTDASQLLSQLRDIHGAGPPEWWPPAPGWWVLAAIGLALLVWIFRKIAQIMTVTRRRRRWLLALEDLNRDFDPAQFPHEYLAGINTLFRAVALKAFPGSACARLQGREWVAFISSRMPEAAGGNLDALSSGPYQPVPDFDATALSDMAETWVKRHG